MVVKMKRNRARGVLALAGFVCWGLIANPAVAGSAPTDHGPIGVMGDYTRDAGEGMLSYRSMRMGMNGSRDEDERISGRRVPADHAVTPTKMVMEMHRFRAMYAPIDRLTIMLMLPFVSLEMEYRNRMGVAFTTRGEGIGDVRATGRSSISSRSTGTGSTRTRG